MKCWLSQAVRRLHCPVLSFRVLQTQPGPEVSSYYSHYHWDHQWEKIIHDQHYDYGKKISSSYHPLCLTDLLDHYTWLTSFAIIIIAIIIIAIVTIIMTNNDQMMLATPFTWLTFLIEDCWRRRLKRPELILERFNENRKDIEDECFADSGLLWFPDGQLHNGVSHVLHAAGSQTWSNRRNIGCHDVCKMIQEWYTLLELESYTNEWCL